MVANRAKSNFIMQLISEFVFLEKDTDSRRSGSQNAQFKRSSANFNKFEEFQMIMTLIDYFSQQDTDCTRNAIFISLFGPNLNQLRTKILCKLVSTSISGAVAPVLLSVGTWMQQIGCATTSCQDVAQSIVSDFVTFSHKISEQMKQLPIVAPHFTANLITAITHLYVNDQRNPITLPPDGLVDLFCEWLTDNPSLCMASQQPLELPSGAIAMPAISPFIGLIRWSVFSPFTGSYSPKLSYLHLTILRTFLAISNDKAIEALNVQDLIRLIESLKSLVSKSNKECTTKLASNNLCPEKSPYELSVERFGQAIQVAISSRCVTSNVTQLLCALETLPTHPLLTLVIKQNRNPIQIPISMSSEKTNSEAGDDDDVTML